MRVTIPDPPLVDLTDAAHDLWAYGGRVVTLDTFGPTFPLPGLPVTLVDGERRRAGEVKAVSYTDRTVTVVPTPTYRPVA